jgi:TPR repeat protein
MYQLGQIYQKGQGVPRSKADAYKWFSVAANFGDIESVKARDLLVRSISSKELLEITQSTDDFIKAKTSQHFDDLRKAAENGDGNAMFVFAQENNARGEYKTAADWFRRAAEKGHAGAQVRLGVMCFNGQGVEQSFTEAAQWFQKAADQNNSVAQFFLGMCYNTGHGVNQDDAIVEKWMRKSAEQGYVEAEYFLGEMYSLGKQVPQNFPEAAKWFNLAAAQGHAVAQYYLGQSYVFGRGVGVNYPLAVKWFRQAAQQGDAAAQRELGVALAKGLGTLLDEIESYKWLSLAAAQEDGRAKEYLAISNQMMNGSDIAEGRRRLTFFVPQKSAATITSESILTMFRNSWNQTVSPK